MSPVVWYASYAPGALLSPVRASQFCELDKGVKPCGHPPGSCY